MRYWLECSRDNADRVPELKFHDLRQAAVRNMRRTGVSQAIWMRIYAQRTDSMERRYNIVDGDDLNVARELLQNRRKGTPDGAASVTNTVTTARKSEEPRDTAPAEK